MKTEEILKRLRATKKATKKAQAPKEKPLAVAPPTPKKPLTKDTFLLAIAGGIVLLLLISLLAVMRVKNKAENLAEALTPETIQGLRAETDFDPNKGVTYVQVQEGQDRTYVRGASSVTIPIISRSNFKALTKEMFETIGAAPWALTRNFAVNLADVELLRFLLSKEELAQAFLEREDVSSLVEDPQLLAAYVQDQESMGEFFDSDVVRGVLANELLTRTVAGSRFMSHLLISPSGKYFRQHPDEAVQLIVSSPYLRALRDNKGVQKAVRENPYLKNLADVLLGTDKKKIAPVEQGSTLRKNTSNKTTAGKKGKK